MPISSFSSGVAPHKLLCRRPSSIVATILLLSCFSGQFCLGRNVRLVFPHIGVGDVFTVIMDLANKGAAEFDGFFAVFDDDGFFLPVVIDGVPVSSFHDFKVPKGAVRRFELTRAGPDIGGHIIVWDRRTPTTISSDELIEGTLVYQSQNGGSVGDSIGVPTFGLMEHFYFIGEFSDSVNMGLALSNFIDATGAAAQVTVNLKAFSGSGQFIDGRTLVLDRFNHEAFFIDQKLSIPKGFRGTVEVEADKPIGALVLRVENNQLSAVGVSAFIALYDVDIILPGQTLQAEAGLAVRGGIVTGLVRITDPQPDSGFEVVVLTGTAVTGVLRGFMVTFFDGVSSVIVVESTSFSTTADSIGGSVVVWQGSAGPVFGIFSGTRRN